VVLLPVFDLGLSQTDDVLSGVGRSLAADAVQEVQATGGLVQGLFVASGIAELTAGVLLDQGSGLSVVLLLADDLLHRANLLCNFFLTFQYYTQKNSKIKYNFPENENLSCRKVEKTGFLALKTVNILCSMYKKYLNVPISFVFVGEIY